MTTASESAVLANDETAAKPADRPNRSAAELRVTGKLARWRKKVIEIGQLEGTMRALSDPALRKESLSLQYRARSGESLESLLVEAYALAREAGRRALRMRHFDVQILGGIAIFHGSIAEMETGEGKTLTATLPLYLHSLVGKGSHLATVNDYLAKRDAEIMLPLYRALGLSVGIIQTDMPRNDRIKAYAADITYGTSKEFGFDFLKDRLLLRRLGEGSDAIDGAQSTAVPMGNQGNPNEQPVQRGMHFALVDEADSILIDEARTPLIISAAPGEAQMRAVACYQWAAEVAFQFEEDEHYEYDHEKKTVELTFEGRHLTRKLEKPEEMGPVGLVDIYQYIERAIKVGKEFQLHQQYVVNDGEIVIVDEFTGRMAEGRKWSAGIHQSVEAKEGVEITVETGHAARVTVQDLFRRYEYLGGMTGTAATSARELKKIYETPVYTIPTNRLVQRQRLPDQIYPTGDEKWAAIVVQVQEMHSIGRPVLIGTRSIDKSELLSELLSQAGISHQVLNARHVAREAEIVSQAGQMGRVTVATNMAGRGTDIKLGEGVAELGGLHVICTEVHDSARIDRQLAGRCGRQGDPGSIQQFLALDDEILEMAFGEKKANKLANIRRISTHGTSTVSSSVFRKAQRKIERRHFRGRKVMLYQEKHRKKMHVEMGQDPYLDMPDQ